jgi:hypothetical protein
VVSFKGKFLILMRLNLSVWFCGGGGGGIVFVDYTFASQCNKSWPNTTTKSFSIFS